MKKYIQADEWNIIEEGFDPHYNKISESIFSLGNGRMGQRANFEEEYTGESMLGNYIAGVYYPDKTRVGWWKNGYPEYFAKVLNAANWISIRISIDGQSLDLARCKVLAFKRVLNMKEGYLERSFTVELQGGKQVEVSSTRFLSIANDELAAIRYCIKALNFDGSISISPLTDGDIMNQDANYDEKFWDLVHSELDERSAYLTLRTRKTGFEVCTGTIFNITRNDGRTEYTSQKINEGKVIGHKVDMEIKRGTTLCMYKYAVNLSSENHPVNELVTRSKETLEKAHQKGFDALLQDQANAWAQKWEESDILIEGDVPAQQAIRFNIFQLHQTYTGKDARLNIGPKGFTGEKYGGSTYWDTEAYCLPFYLSTAPEEVSRNLLLYRYKHLDKAIENAAKLGFGSGAALYPMVTMNGEECHNEWEITFEEIHRNGAIAYAIFNYIRYTGDESYLAEHGLEVLIGIARFWKQRVNWSIEKSKYVMLGVTGPNEYENNVNNNWYTSMMATWCLKYTLEAAEKVQDNDPGRYAQIVEKTQLNAAAEFQAWQKVVDNMFYPESKELGVFLQQDGYLDKEQVLVKDLDAKDLPLNQKWSWDRILRSCFIKQADVLPGLYFFEDDSDLDTLRRNFDFYEPRTVHESSLSPCVHAILAAKLGDEQRAYEFYLRTSRLDLDDYNNDTEDGLHITSMAGTWMSVVEGFAGMRVRNGELHFTPFLPAKWNSFAFNIRFRGSVITVRVEREGVNITHLNGPELTVNVSGHAYAIHNGESIFAEYGLSV